MGGLAINDSEALFNFLLSEVNFKEIRFVLSNLINFISDFQIVFLHFKDFARKSLHY